MLKIRLQFVVFLEMQEVFFKTRLLKFRIEKEINKCKIYSYIIKKFIFNKNLQSGIW